MLRKIVETVRFGTEGSVVQIHSPRPIPRKISEIQSVRSLGSVAEFALRNRVIGASNHVSIPNRLKFIDKTPQPIHLRLCRGQAVTLQVTEARWSRRPRTR